MGKQEKDPESDDNDYESEDDKKKISLKRKTAKKNVKKIAKGKVDVVKKNTTPKKPEAKKPLKTEDEEKLKSKSKGKGEKEQLFLPGQKYATPEEGDGTRAFYESLYEQKPESKMAEKWCLEYGLFEKEKAIQIKNKLDKLKKAGK